MAGPGLAARCPACNTVFRVVPDQLRVSDGWVRCGRCSEVFNAAESLVDVETGAPLRAAVAQTLPEPGPEVVAAHEAPEWVAQEAAQVDHDPPVQEHVQETADEGQPLSAASPTDFLFDRIEPSFDANNEPSPAPAPAAAAAAESIDATRPSDAQVSDPDPASPQQPSFLRQAERAARWRRPRVRAGLVALGLVAGAALVAQVSYEYRDLMAARFPATRPALVWACSALGCKVEAARSINSLAVESSGLVRVEKSSIYKLQVTLRNSAGIDVAVPALDLSFTDNQGRLIARKVLRAAELGAQQTTLGAGRELALQATLQGAAGSNEPIAGYTIELFYP